MKIRELLSTKEKWTRHACFRDRNGSIVHEPEKAYSYCLVGALLKCYQRNVDRLEVMKKIKEQVGELFPSHWNDRHSYEDVKQLVDSLDI